MEEEQAKEEAREVAVEDPHLVCHIKYKVVGSFKDYGSALTSFDYSYRDEALKEVSIVKFSNRAAAVTYMDDMTLCEGPKIARCLFINDHQGYVFIDRVNADIESWIEHCFTDFTNQQLQTQDWWTYLEPKFRKLFSDVILGFNHLVRLDAYSGGLRNTISVDLAKNSARYSYVIRSPPNDPSFGILGNMSELKTLMEDCLLRPYKDVHFAGLPEARVEHYMNEQGIPYDLKLFLWILQDPQTLRTFDIKWILDNPFFWSNSKKLSFVRKVHCQVYRLQDINNFSDMDFDLYAIFGLGSHLAWATLLPPNGPVREVYKHTRNDQLETRRKRGGTGCIPFNSFFLGIAILFKNIVGHYSSHAGGAITDETSIGIADRVFRCSCAYLQYVMGRFFFVHNTSHQQGEPWNFYLSEKDY